MPPIKARMMNRMGAVASVQQSTKYIRNVQKTTIARRKHKSSPIKSSTLPEHIKEDSKLMAMRMPEDIVKILPSVKKYKGSKDFVDLTDDVSCASESNSVCRSESEADVASLMNSSTPHATLTAAATSRTRSALNCKYNLKQTAEERFLGIIFDVAVSPAGHIFISCCEGIFMCDTQLERKMKLAQIILPGGVSFMPDERIVVICRNLDTVNFFSKDGIFIKAFKAGFSPMALVINSCDELLVSDPGHKCVHVFNTSGEELYTLPSSTLDYSFRWPLYMSLVDGDNLLVCDCHNQKVLQFDPKHKYLRTYQLNTSCGNTLLRPHGVATNQQSDLFIVDTTMDTIEVFTLCDTYVQTLIHSDEGSQLKPKCLAFSPNGLLIVGGRLGVVRIYEFVECTKPELEFEKTPLKEEYDFKTAKLRSSSKRKHNKDLAKQDVSKAKRNVFKSECSDEVSVKIESKDSLPEREEIKDVIELTCDSPDSSIVTCSSPHVFSLSPRTACLDQTSREASNLDNVTRESSTICSVTCDLTNDDRSDDNQSTNTKPMWFQEAEEEQSTFKDLFDCQSSVNSDGTSESHDVTHNLTSDVTSQSLNPSVEHILSIEKELVKQEKPNIAFSFDRNTSPVIVLE